MKLSTRSRYGTRMMLDLANHYEEGPVQIGDVAKREDISVKYLEQLIIPLKKASLIESVRGPKGGHMLAKPPEEITIGEIVRVLEGGMTLTQCIENPAVCEKSNDCLTRGIWEEATQVMYDALNASTLGKIIQAGHQGEEGERSAGKSG
ncbi:MAG: Rrf2 family transcriptional regulator [Deltaproteobacteria bacterium]|nr:Rrf2 family transcriptional regulator [Deltaproteobacteria bacterium]